MTRPFILTLLTGVIALLLCAAPAQAQDGAIRSPTLGINHISAPNDPNPDPRYRNALLLGAGWNRWPLYWNAVENTPGNYDWSGYDRLAANDVGYGLRTNAILLGIPQHQMENGRMRGIYEPVFSDGSDIPGNSAPNPNNPYAQFVYNAVMRYKPGGTLARQLGWQGEQGIRIWEAWNEPDLRMFWSGSVQDYARLLKVTYLVVRQADPLAKVMFAGLAYIDPDWNDYLARTLGYFQQDPLRDTYNWFFDIAAVHTYTNPERTWQMVRRMKQVLAAYGLDRPVWVNESGVPVWDDYPGQTWTAGSPGARQFRGTMQEQAIYMIESTALAWAAGAEVVFHFQLYDDCGNQASGTNFPPDSGQAGDAYGLFRNDRDNSCFRESPQPNTPRPAASTFYRMAQVFGGRMFNGGQRISLNGRGTALVFSLSPLQGVANYGPVTGGSSGNINERALVLWNNSRERLVVEIPASGQSAVLYDMYGVDYMLTPQNGIYTIGLPAVQQSDFPQLAWSEVSRISGAPYILVEQVEGVPASLDRMQVRGSEVPPSTTSILEAATRPPELAFVPTPLPTQTPAPTPTPRPTTDPALDTVPPLPIMLAMPEVSPVTFTVRWNALDNSGIASYLVWVRVNGGAWENWLETSATQALYYGEPGNTYEFALWAVDLAGNWSSNVELEPQAVTRVN